MMGNDGKILVNDGKYFVSSSSKWYLYVVYDDGRNSELCYTSWMIVVLNPIVHRISIQ